MASAVWSKHPEERLRLEWRPKARQRRVLDLNGWDPDIWRAIQNKTSNSYVIEITMQIVVREESR